MRKIAAIICTTFMLSGCVTAFVQRDDTPEVCQVFDYRYAPENKAMCDKWEIEHEYKGA